MKNYLLLFIGLLLSLPLCAANNLEEPVQPEVVVTATRTAKTVDDALASVTVITRADIERSQALTMPDLLKNISGLDIVSNGGLGKATSVFVRGTESGHVLVLVDGVKIGSATLGSVSLQDLPLAQIERIEVVRGARSSLYGSEAIGGVIQIFTRKGQGESRFEASIGTGNRKTYQATAGFSGSTPDNWYSLYANHLQSDDFNSCVGSLTGGCFTLKHEKNGYDNTSFSARAGQRFGQNVNLEIQALRMSGTNQFDSDYNNQTNFVQQVIGLKADIVMNKSWLMSVQVGNSRDDQRNFGHVPDTFFNTHRSTVAWQNNFLFSDNHILTVGYDYQNDNVTSDTAYTVNSRHNHGVFAQYQLQLDKVNLLGGLRYDRNQQFGEHTTGNVGIGYALTQEIKGFASYGTAFKAPTFNQLYYPDFGNPAIKPEESKSVEIGITGTHTDKTWTMSTYHTKIDKLIGGFPVNNIDKAKITGVEGSFSWKLANWHFNTNATWLKPENSDTGKLLPRRAQQTVNMELGSKFGQIQTTAGILAQSHRFEDAANTQRLSGYATLNLRAEYAFDKHWLLRARLDNALDKTYQTALFYDAPGRAVLMSIHYQQ